MNNIVMILWVVSFILLLLAALGVSSGRVNLGWAGLAALVLGMVIGG